MTETIPLPEHGTKIRCINNTDRPELKVGETYAVAAEPDLEKMPINYARYQPEDFRLIAIVIPGQRELGVFPFGVFEIVRSK